MEKKSLNKFVKGDNPRIISVKFGEIPPKCLEGHYNVCEKIPTNDLANVMIF